MPPAPATPAQRGAQDGGARVQPRGCEQHRWSHGCNCAALGAWQATPAKAGMPGGAMSPPSRGWPSARVCPRDWPV
eukprot:4304746-Alexandrium_andersonii.AAC.1